MNSKTLIGGIVGVLVIILIVWYAKSHPQVRLETSDVREDLTGATDYSNEESMETGTQSNGLQITTLAQGTGEGAKAGDKVTVNYTGMLESGAIFDSNVDPKFQHVEPFTFTLGVGQVIQGWDQGVLGMKVGEKRHLVIPASLGYGAQGAGSIIPPNATLIFDVEVTKIAH